MLLRMPSRPAAMFAAMYRYGLAAGSPMRFSMWAVWSPAAPCTRIRAPRFSTAQFTRSGANEYGLNRLYPVVVGVVNTVMGRACSRIPATNFRPVSDNGWDGSVNAFDPFPPSRSDSCRCQPLEKKLGNAGRHINEAW